MFKQQPTILCIDDDEDDLYLLEEAVTKLPKKYKIVKAHNGIQGLEKLNILRASNEFPCLIILDLNMPVMNGKETLMEIQKDAELSKVPVVIFSTSSNPKDRAYFSGCNIEYFTKPVNLNHFTEVAIEMLNSCND